MTSVRRGVRCFFADRSGAIVPIAAAGLTMAAAMGALAIDMSRAYSVQNELQTAVDAAAMAAARDLRDPALTRRTARRLVEARFPPELHGQVLADRDVEIGTWDAEQKRFTPGNTPPNALRLTARRAEANGNPQPTTLARVIGYASLDLEASATASVGSRLPFCLLALNPTAANASEAAGSSELVADDCVVYANSNDSDAIHARSGASITASAVCAHGGVRGAHRITPAPETGCPRLADPLATGALRRRRGRFFRHHGTARSGIYCGGINVTSGTTVHLRPGV